MKPATGGEGFWSPPRRTKSFPKKTGRHAGRRVGGAARHFVDVRRLER